MRPGHAGVGLERSSSGKNLFIRRSDVRVCSHDGRDSPVQIEAHGFFFTRSLCVKIDEDDMNFRWDAGNLSIGCPEGAIIGRHKNASLQVQHSIRNAVASRAHV